ncbi:CCAAT/enhancer-binding protein gamma isoform X1 [Pantherophis guttatus]|uniref:CCAAT/enhancer-binding protein gamma isoform X1 n=1 Tax=Pantherophis guttatus TaxID=94885 RepID=A0ABM3YN20_PANGU|nr:CCAAT/enhancer-binding protein gamma isoform X1 [Pantherophis guttatus]
MDDSGRQGAFSEEGSWSPQPDRAGWAPAKPRTGSIAAAAKIRARAKGPSKADEKTAQISQKPLDKEFAKASVERQLASLPPDLSVQQAQPLPSMSGIAWSWSPEAQEDPQPRPGPSEATPKTPDATFTPTAAELHQGEVGEQDMPHFMRQWVNEAIRRGIGEGMHQHFQVPAQMYTSAPEMEPPKHLPEAMDYQDPDSPDPSELSFYSKDYQGERDFSDFKHGSLAKKPFKGLFNPALLKPLLAKARATACLGKASPATGPTTDSGEQDDFLFTEQAGADTIPIPGMFLEMIRRQWAAPTSAFRATGQENLLFDVDKDLLNLLQLPKVDSPVAALTSSSILPPDAEDALKGEERREETALRRAHMANSWAIRASTAASFFTRASVRWLRQLQSHLPAEDVRAHQDLSNILAAAEYTADATLASAKFSARAMASSVTARRMLWLRHWRMDAKNKWKLVSTPFDGGHLFGQSLDPLLVETSDKRKVLPSQGRRADFCPTPYFRRPSFRQGGAGAGFPQQQRSFQSSSGYQTDRPTFGRDRQPQSGRPYSGNGGRGAKRTK